MEHYKGGEGKVTHTCVERGNEKDISSRGGVGFNGAGLVRKESGETRWPDQKSSENSLGRKGTRSIPGSENKNEMTNNLKRERLAVKTKKRGRRGGIASPKKRYRREGKQGRGKESHELLG